MRTKYLHVQFSLKELSRWLKQGNILGIKFQRDETTELPLTLRATPIFERGKEKELQPVYGKPLPSINPEFEFFERQGKLDYIMFINEQLEMLQAYDGAETIVLSGAWINYGSEGTTQGAYFTLKAEVPFSELIIRGIEANDDVVDPKDPQGLISRFRNKIKDLLTGRIISDQDVERELKAAVKRTESLQGGGNLDNAPSMMEEGDGFDTLTTSDGIPAVQLGWPCPPRWPDT